MRIIDSHTAGEPTRTVIEGGPSLEGQTVSEMAANLQAEHEAFCKAVLLEPRGHDAIVGALLVPSSEPDCVTGVIYFNPAGNLGMCGHATIGLAVTLHHMGKIDVGRHRIETPIGVVTVDLHNANEVSVVNVESYRYLKDVTLPVEGHGIVKGDVAWGGNWFFLTKDSPLALDYKNIVELTAYSQSVRKALKHNNIMGKDGAEIDHIELIGPAKIDQHHGRNFVLCPGGAYDRSPCGTGTSAKLACLAEDNLLAPGAVWVQESIIDSLYQLSYQTGERGGIVPTVTGRAYVTAESFLIFDPADPYRTGIQPD